MRHSPRPARLRRSTHGTNRQAGGGEDIQRPSRKIYITADTSGLYNELKSSREVYNVKRDFTVVIERDEDGIYVASVPELVGCHTQAKTLDELRERIIEAVQLYLEVESEKVGASEFIGIQRVGVSV
jgi:predicted RNase H-like HicB family nuclease